MNNYGNGNTIVCCKFYLFMLFFLSTHAQLEVSQLVRMRSMMKSVVSIMT